MIEAVMAYECLKKGGERDATQPVKTEENDFTPQNRYWFVFLYLEKKYRKLPFASNFALYVFNTRCPVFQLSGKQWTPRQAVCTRLQKFIINYSGTEFVPANNVFLFWIDSRDCLLGSGYTTSRDHRLLRCVYAQSSFSRLCHREPNK